MSRSGVRIPAPALAREPLFVEVSGDPTIPSASSETFPDNNLITESVEQCSIWHWQCERHPRLPKCRIINLSRYGRPRHRRNELPIRTGIASPPTESAANRTRLSLLTRPTKPHSLQPMVTTRSEVHCHASRCFDREECQPWPRSSDAASTREPTPRSALFLKIC